ncbi:hypothetical protein ACFUJR_22565 [Streptomyces sp. NPDC057271]
MAWAAVLEGRAQQRTERCLTDAVLVVVGRGWARVAPERDRKNA